MPILLVPSFRGFPEVVPIPRAPSAHFPTLALNSFVYLTAGAFTTIANLASGATLGHAFATGSTYNYVNLVFGAETLGGVSPLIRVAILNGVSTVATFEIPLLADRDQGMQNFCFVTDFPFTLINLTNLTAGNATVYITASNTSSPSQNINDFDFKNLINAKIANNAQPNNANLFNRDVGPNVTP